MRVTQPGRYAEDFEEEVDHAPAPEDWVTTSGAGYSDSSS